MNLVRISASGKGLLVHLQRVSFIFPRCLQNILRQLFRRNIMIEARESNSNVPLGLGLLDRLFFANPLAQSRDQLLSGQ